MRGLLCRAFLDFTRQGVGLADGAGCDAGTCPGPGHLRLWSQRAADAAGVAPALLLERFGATLFGHLVRGYPSFFVGIESTAELVGRYQTHVAAELQKLDDAARPPELWLVRRAGEPTLVVYRSPFRLDALARGMLRGSLEHFGEPYVVEPVAAAGDEARFCLQPRPEAFRLGAPR